MSGIPHVGMLALAAVAYGVHRSTATRPVNTTLQPLPPAPAVPVAVGLPVARRGAPHQPGESPLQPRAPAKRVLLTPRTVRPVPWRARTSQFVESASLAALFTAVFTACIALFAPDFFGARGASSTVDPALVGLFGVTSLAGAWSLLGANKLLEGRSITFGVRRIVQFLIGCVVGEIAWGLSSLLFVEMSDSREAAFRSINSQPLISGAGPTWLGYIVFFGLLFGLRRWWWQSDSYRPKRFRIMSVALTMALAAGVMFAFEFEFGWGLVWAAVISSVVQLSSAWTPPAARVEG
jgi:hypothetical protein